MNPETRARLVAIAGRSQRLRRVAGVAEVTMPEAHESGVYRSVTHATLATPHESRSMAFRPGAETNDINARFPELSDIMERAAIIEIDGGLPRAISERLAILQMFPPPDQIASQRWKSLIDAAGRLADRWGTKAPALGWTLEDLFGAYPGGSHGDMGLLSALKLGDVVASLSEACAVIETATGIRQIFRRRAPSKQEADSRMLTIASREAA